ncbi:MAG: imm11 family protein [Spongiibacter marinus]|uniref:imm11 family protein n=1 Tax=Spongiibacter marinus TaxID=354246 RepID=UPI003C5B78DD
MSYYEITDDVNFPNRWYLGDIAYVNNWELAHHLDPEREYEVEVCRNGSEMDYTSNEVYGVSVVSKRFKEAISGISNVSFAKANIAGINSGNEYYIMAVTKELECIDEEVSEFQKFEVNDPVRPDKAGDYRGFFKMVVNPEKCAGFNIFRVKGFSIAIIVSEKVKKMLESAGTSGAKFKRV